VSSDGAAARLDIERIVGQATRADHLYCCGPDRMLAAFRSATSARDPSTVHWDYFEAPVVPTAPTAAAGRYTLELKRSERTLIVEPGATVLDTLLSAGIDAPYGCRQGICGSCEVGVLDGTPDHRDLVLSDEERAANRTMMPCCSGCIGERLVLDL
jgi:vanillate O-demethylase ferredoxin subunit